MESESVHGNHGEHVKPLIAFLGNLGPETEEPLWQENGFDIQSGGDLHSWVPWGPFTFGLLSLRITL